ncbi:ATP-dependent exoDNAse (exonuclease V) beta subunit (contains helicase and exonuclease domains) [Ekhidna lutea]|uniref:DNA 3'-5' helicase n=1 Tax=Ekhidna lutea TaxID=447679 RepID=A0A239HVV9_EKHLU|nr:UvrD-helicase domain-containing protein [Ekhidna lutea]SNS84314.1 ATP-dependent exoDNAse (exonuclease V) beta subunit (contains helicase and exonuclease domains) [Ekhidna lutea]
MSLTIYRSSAGSGKTYTLAKEYLKLALRSPDYYQRILAVTFTNRAAEEMKERVLEFLIDISKGKHELISVYEEELGKSRDEIMQAATKSLTHLLHHYGYFNITTIDTFFHRVIRAFSREIGLQGSFGIELDIDKVAEFITSHVFQGVEENKQLRDWLVDFSMSKVLDGSSYEFKDDVNELARQLFKEEFKKLPKGQFEDEQAREKVKELKSELLKKKLAFEQTIKKYGQQFFDALEGTGIELDDFSGGKKRTIPNFFNRLLNADYSINKTIQSATDDASAWSAKTSPKRDLIIQFAENNGIALLKQMSEYVEQNEKDYLTVKAILKHLFTVGLIANLSQQLQEYKREEEVIMISDLPDFLSQIIDDSGSPFIYEKVGTRYSHFLIDEFQDTSQFQWNNFKPLLEESLANGNENVVVGDAKQSIYGWRGGDPTLLLKGIQKDLSAELDHTKSTNWRSARNIVEFNNKLFSSLPRIMADEMSEIITSEERDTILATYDEVEQEVAPKNQLVDGLVQVEFLEAERGEWKQRAMERTTEVIESLLLEGHQLNDMAILVRSNRDAADIVNHVLEYRRTTETKVEVISAEGMLLANSSVVQLLLSAFKHLIQPEDKSILADLVYRYQQDSKNRHFESHADFSKLATGGLPGSFTKYKQHLLHLPILELTEVLIRCFELDKVKAEFAYLQAFQDAVLEYSKNHRSDLRLFLEWWEDAGKKRSVQLTGALDAVEVITSHKSKGLQYPIVIVPFCNYRFDAMSQPTWYQSPYNNIEAVPVDYKSELDKTHFSPSYKKDFAKWHLESLNVLYVAFTRAENGLYAFCEPPPKKQDTMFGTASKLLFKYFDSENPEGWNAAASIYHKGTLPVKHREAPDQLTALKGYPTFKWSKKLTVRKTGKAYYDDEVEKQRNEGILLHQILSEIIHWEQTKDVLDRYERSMQITPEDRKRYETLINNLWKDEQIKSWFSGIGEVKTEVVVLPKDGDTKRMDRVVIDGNKARVIDFKSGFPKSEDNRQLKEYASLLAQMGYEVEGYLLYLKSGEVREV